MRSSALLMSFQSGLYQLYQLCLLCLLYRFVTRCSKGRSNLAKRGQAIAPTMLRRSGSPRPSMVAATLVVAQ